MGGGPGCGDGQGQRQPGAPGDDVGHRSRLAGHPARPQALGEQVTGVGGGQQIEGQREGAVGGDQPGQPVAAGHHGQAAGRAGQQRADLLDVPRVVQHDQDPLARQQAAVERGLGGQGGRDPGRGHPERLQEPTGRLARLQGGPAWVEALQVDVQLPVREPCGDPVRPVHGQGGLAHPGGAGQDRGDRLARPGRARLGRGRQECVEPGQLGPAAREGRHRRRQLGRDRYRRCGLRHRGRGRGCVEGGILPEDGRLQVAQLQAGVDAEFLIERAVQAPVGGQRVGLPAAAVQRQHELGLGLLIQRPGGHQLFQFGQ